MKKFRAYLLTLMLAVSLTACTSQTAPVSGDDVTIETALPETTGENEQDNESQVDVDSQLQDDKQSEESEVAANQETEGIDEVQQTSDMQVHFVDTGNSDSILIVSAGEAMVIDGGDNDDEKPIVQYIQNQGISKIKYVVSTHAHADHVGGLDAIVKNFNVERVFVSNGDTDTKTYQDFIRAAMDKGLQPSVPLEGKKFVLGDAYFTVMNTNGGGDTNNQSLIVELVNGNDKMLFMGDAEQEVEDEILEQVGDIDLLKLGHHGSRTSSSPEFLAKVKPEYAVILCGKDNSYGHPHKETMNRLKNISGLHLYRTDECGTVVFTSTGDGLHTDAPEGDYTPGTGSSQGASNNVGTGSSQGASNNAGTGSSQEASNNVGIGSSQEASNNAGTGSETVYWTPKGKSYHKSKDCPTLSRSKIINSGTIEQSGKDDPCDKCYGL